MAKDEKKNEKDSKKYSENDQWNDDLDVMPLNYVKPEGKKPIVEKAEFDKKKAELVDNYEDEFANPYKAASLGYIDEVIFPEDTRERLINYFKVLENKSIKRPNRKHGNIPL